MFNSHELSYVNNKEIFKVKSTLTKKVEKHFCALEEAIKSAIKKNNYLFDDRVKIRTGKISRGENYNGYPYLMLDYPGYFSREAIFAFRFMFWWGHYWSHYLLISGSIKAEMQQNFLQNKGHLADLLIDVHTDPWKHEIENNPPISTLSKKEYEYILKEKDFVKYTKALPLEDDALSDGLMFFNRFNFLFK